MIDTQDRNGIDTELIDNRRGSSVGGFIESQARGEVDTQISTARRFPRSVKKFQSKAMELATLDQETAGSCFYSLPRDGKNIEGPSARLAEIVVGAWGNVRSQANVVDIDGSFVTVRGMCWDLENNVAVSTEVRRRITNKQGRRFSDDMIVTTANAACSIALRNAIFKVVPMALVRPIYLAARRVAVGDATTLVDRRSAMLAYFAKMGVRSEQICLKVDKPGIEDINLDDLGTLLGISTAIKEGDTTVDEEFPPIDKKTSEKKSKGDQIADEINKSNPNQGKSDVNPQAESDKQSSKKPAVDKAKASMFNILSADLKKSKDADELQRLMEDISEAIQNGTVSQDEGEALILHYNSRMEIMNPK